MRSRVERMNPASEWRLEKARGVAKAYASNPKVVAVFVGGSVSRGHADRYSDVEMGVVWRDGPTDEERQEAVRASGETEHRFYPYDAEEEVWPDDIFLGQAPDRRPGSGLLVEVVNQTSDRVEQVLKDVLVGYDPVDFKLGLMAALVTAIPLHGEEIIEGWRARASDYPRGLMLAVVRKHAQIDHYWRMEMLLERGRNLMLVYDTLVNVSKKLVSVLLSMNGIYSAGFSSLKWLDYYAGQMEITPSDFGLRLKQVFEVEPERAIEEMRALVEETYDLIERELPEVDVEWLRRVFRYRREEWEG